MKFENKTNKPIKVMVEEIPYLSHTLKKWSTLKPGDTIKAETERFQKYYLKEELVAVSFKSKIHDKLVNTKKIDLEEDEEEPIEKKEIEGKEEEIKKPDKKGKKK